MSGENIEYMIYVLMWLTVVVVLVLVYIFLLSKKNKGKLQVGIQNDDTNQKIEGVLVHQWGEEKKPGVSVHLWKEDLKKMNSFKINPIALFKANIFKNNLVISGDMQDSTPVLDVYDFYFRIQKFLNKLFVEEIYNISKEELFEIHKYIWKMDLDLLKNKIIQVSEKNGLLEEGRDSSMLFRKIITWAISHPSYLIFKETHREQYQEKIKNGKRALEKKLLESEVGLSPKEQKALKDYDAEKEINREIKKVIGNTWWNLLSFDIEHKEIHINIHYNDILDKRIGKLVTYYKNKKNLVNIIFYI